VSGLLLVDKPQGITSHDVVARARRLLGTRKVGHAGTLDPMATGLLLLGVDSSTRLLSYLVGLDKEYTATIRLGVATDTDDAEGETIATRDASGVTDAAIASGIAALTGPIEQVPSTFSAIKVDGRRAYDLARAGEAVDLRSRPVTIHAFELLGTQRDEQFIDLAVRVACSSGTYIRALARDLGDSQTRDIAHGKRIELQGADAELADVDLAAALTPDGRLAALIELRRGRARVLLGMPTTEVLE
jgi:tRNA pseudouridine55 synthase